MSSKVRLILLCFFTLGLSACSPENKSVNGTPPEVPTPMPKGTGDSGGGNSFRGKPLEAYIASPLVRVPGTGRLVSLLEKIRSNHPTLDRILSSTMTSKPWYFVPGPLASLPSDRVGSAVPTEQFALQTFDAVWMDTDLIDKMTPEEQDHAVLHEILMGVRLLRHASPAEQCAAVAPQNEHFCAKESKARLGNPSFLNADDHNQVRKLATDLLKYPNRSWDSLESSFASGGFSFGYRKFSSWFPKTIPLIDVLDWTTNAMMSGQMPTHGFEWSKYSSAKNESVKSNDSCQVLFGFTGTDVRFGIEWPGGAVYAMAELNMKQPAFLLRAGDSTIRSVPLVQTRLHEVLTEERFSAEIAFELSGALREVSIYKQKKHNCEPGCTVWKSEPVFTCTTVQELLSR